MGAGPDRKDEGPGGGGAAAPGPGGSMGFARGALVTSPLRCRCVGGAPLATATSTGSVQSDHLLSVVAGGYASPRRLSTRILGQANHLRRRAARRLIPGRCARCRGGTPARPRRPARWRRGRRARRGGPRPTPRAGRWRCHDMTIGANGGGARSRGPAASRSPQERPDGLTDPAYHVGDRLPSALSAANAAHRLGATGGTSRAQWGRSPARRRRTARRAQARPQ